MPRDLATASARRGSPSFITTAVTVAPLIMSTSLFCSCSRHLDDVAAHVAGDEFEKPVLRNADEKDGLVVLRYLRTRDRALDIETGENLDRLSRIAGVAGLEDVARDLAVLVGCCGGRGALDRTKAVRTGKNVGRLDLCRVGAKTGRIDGRRRKQQNARQYEQIRRTLATSFLLAIGPRQRTPESSHYKLRMAISL